MNAPCETKDFESTFQTLFFSPSTVMLGITFFANINMAYSDLSNIPNTYFFSMHNSNARNNFN